MNQTCMMRDPMSRKARWSTRPYIEFLCEVDRLLYEQYGVTIDDTGMEIVAGSQESGESPQDAADWYAEHFKLQPIPL